LRILPCLSTGQDVIEEARMHRILVVADQDDPDNPAFARACAIAGENCADLDILRLLEAGRADVGAERHGRFMALIAAARARHPCIGSIAVSVAAHNAKAVAMAAETTGADLLVMRNTIDTTMSHDTPFTLIDRVVHRTALPVLAVQNPADAPYQRLIALTDSGATARQSIELALQVKSARDVYALHASGDAEASADDAEPLHQLVEAIKASRQEASANIHPVVRAGDMATALIRTWQDYRPDLVVAVTRRRRGLRAYLGSSHVRNLLVDMPFDLLIQEAAPSPRHKNRNDRRAAALPRPSSSPVPVLP
jgi:nucleotide-binding universal stress UspA family protein